MEKFLETKDMHAIDVFPALVISLDFELHYGVSSHVLGPGHSYWKNLIEARNVVEDILQLFRENDIHATWATVGFLFAQNRQELESYLPRKRPDYKSVSLNNYKVSVGESEKDDPVHFAASLVLKILETPGQELASHTFSHYYCMELGQTKETFREDLLAAQTIAHDKYGLSLRSLVFPRNQVNEEYIPIIVEQGFEVYRGNPRCFLYNPVCNRWYNSFVMRFFRLIDSYWNFTGHHTLSWFELAGSYPINVRASRFLRPYMSQLRIIDRMRLRRVIDGMRYAAKQKEIFHLWWHPHNFGTNCRENLAALEEILEEFYTLRKTYSMRSLNMLEVANECRRIRKELAMNNSEDKKCHERV
jgi:peptidoglycan/xylan/chitin deacetylase (PgdA/CDA1 family)